MAPPASSSSSPPSSPLQVPPASEIVPVDNEPLHVQRWKTADVRLVDVQFPPHTTSLWHQHVHYGVYIAITPIHAVEQSTQGTQQPSVLTKQRGDVFCRDHTKDRLTHVVTTDAEPMRIIEVELVRDARRLAETATLPPHHAHRCVVLVHEDERCRVHRITLLRGAEGANEVDLVLPTDAVLVAVHGATVALLNPSVNDKIHAEHAKGLLARKLTLAAGDDVQLVAGAFRLQCVDWSDAGVADFILTEVF